MGTKQKVLTIKDKLHKLEKELVEIQTHCSHTKSSLKFINLNTGVRWVCDECQTTIGFPNPQEITEWVKK
tara:strand:+ start:232 stop:441 length:210 start_codon:yes stop_codon:yes gene_type:complete